MILSVRCSGGRMMVYKYMFVNWMYPCHMYSYAYNYPYKVRCLTTTVPVRILYMRLYVCVYIIPVYSRCLSLL